MKVMRGKFFRACVRKSRKFWGKAVPSSAASVGGCCQWFLWSSLLHDENKNIPRDVPKGHLVVYVGEDRKRFVIKVSLLKHPLFRALLDHAREVYDFTADSKLCIPCHESEFLSVVRCATSPEEQGFCFCL